MRFDHDGCPRGTRSLSGFPDFGKVGHISQTMVLWLLVLFWHWYWYRWFGFSNKHCSRSMHPTLTHQWTRAQFIWPGVAVCGVVALAAGFLADHYGGPQLLYALLLGLALNFLSASPHLAPGIGFTSKTLLRLGVALLGARVTVDQIADLGWRTGIIVVVAVAGTIAFGLWLAKAMGCRRDEGWISGVSVAICGASAAMAVSAVMPQTKENERYTLLTVVGVTLLSTLAMVLYPLILSSAGMSAVQAGVFLGGSIHDVAQVVAAGALLGSQTGDTATIVKLFRVSMLAPVVVVVSVLCRRSAVASTATTRPPLLPTFVLGFVALVVVGSAGLIGTQSRELAGVASRALLVAAIAAAGMRTQLHELASLGWKPVLLLIGETLFLALVLLTLMHFST